MNVHLGTYTVSARGQLSLPVEARRRWGLEGGGPVEVVDLGGAALIVPGGSGTLRRLLGEIIDAAGYAELVGDMDDPDLAPQ